MSFRAFFYVAGCLVLLTLVFVLGVYNSGKEVYYYALVSISRIYNKVVDNKVNLYYINDDITTALPMTKTWIWVLDFNVMGMLYALFIYKIYKIYRTPRYLE